MFTNQTVVKTSIRHPKIQTNDKSEKSLCAQPTEWSEAENTIYVNSKHLYIHTYSCLLNFNRIPNRTSVILHFEFHANQTLCGCVYAKWFLNEE